MNRVTILLMSILLVAASLRLVALSTNPPSTYWDETSLGYDAYSLLKTGKDYHGNPFPILAFPSFGDYKPSLYFYAIVPFMAVLGPTTLAIRLPSALAGIVTTWLVYLIGKKLKDERLGLLAALFFAVQPWSVHISRAGFETNLASMLVALGIYFCLRAWQNARFLVGAVIAFGLSMYAYHSARIISPILAFVFTLDRKIWKNFTWVVVAGVIGIIFAFPLALNLKNPIIAQRAAETSIFAGTKIVEKSNALRAEDQNSIVGRILHHRYIVGAQTFTSQYFQNFSMKFLFIDGDENLRHGSKLFGVLYYWEFFAVLIGLYAVVYIKAYASAGKIILPWILIAAIPVALTTVSPHTLRFLPAAPAFSLLSAVGVGYLFEYIHKRWRKIAGIVFSAIVIAHVVAFTYTLFVIYPKTSAIVWQYGYKELVESIEQLRKPNQHVFVTREQGRPSIYFLWYTKQDPHDLQQQDVSLKKDQQELLEFGPYTFGDAIPLEKSLLIASSPSLVPSDVNVLKTISLPTGEGIWSIWERK